MIIHFVAKCFVGMCRNKENDVASEAIVPEWVVSRDFKVVKKQCGHALLSVKCCPSV